jgi:hypothetical protein
MRKVYIFQVSFFSSRFTSFPFYKKTGGKLKPRLKSGINVVADKMLVKGAVVITEFYN